MDRDSQVKENERCEFYLGMSMDSVQELVTDLKTLFEHWDPILSAYPKSALNPSSSPKIYFPNVEDVALGDTSPFMIAPDMLEPQFSSERIWAEHLFSLGISPEVLRMAEPQSWNTIGSTSFRSIPQTSAGPEKSVNIEELLRNISEAMSELPPNPSSSAAILMSPPALSTLMSEVLPEPLLPKDERFLTSYLWGYPTYSVPETLLPPNTLGLAINITAAPTTEVCESTTLLSRIVSWIKSKICSMFTKIRSFVSRIMSPS